MKRTCDTRGTAGFSAKPKPKGKPIRQAWITVLRGKVDVLDLVLHKHFLISAGHTYFAPS